MNKDNAKLKQRLQTAKGDELGLRIKDYLEKGVLVPDEITTQVVLERMSSQGCRGGVVSKSARHQAGMCMLLRRRSDQPGHVARGGQPRIDLGSSHRLRVREQRLRPDDEHRLRHPRRDHDLTRHPALRIVLEHRIQHGVGDLISHLVGMPHGDGFGREEVVRHGSGLIGT